MMDKSGGKVKVGDPPRAQVPVERTADGADARDGRRWLS
jgi:hypothetical protein